MAKKSGRRSSSVPEKTVQVKEKTYAYRIGIELEDYLFFASMEKGKVAETASLLHNYALAYAMGWVDSLYFNEMQSPQYEQQLQPMNEQGVYVYPAVPVHISHRMMQYNTTDEAFLMKRTQSMGYPNWGFIKCIRPGSTFETYILSHDPIQIPSKIRLGKWMSLASITMQEVSLTKKKGNACPHMVNIQDIACLPVYFSAMYNILPTRLVQGVEWDQQLDGYQISYGDHQNVWVPESAFWWWDK
jgi:CRISPR-associated protein Csc1